MKKAFIPVLIIILLQACATTTGSIRFKGETVQDQKTGFTVYADEETKKYNTLAVSSLKYHYFVILPYSEQWVFHEDERFCLLGNADLINFSLEIIKSDQSPKDFLSWHLGELKKPGAVPGLEKAEMKQYRDQWIMKTVVDGEKATGGEAFKGVKHVNFFAVKSWENYLYRYHISRVLRPEEVESFDEKPYMDMATAGFKVDFER
ncbi:MAG: hypothetical protein GWN61_21500 [candidate division Zixibacteria bacterium]|nr:hypothetical protein [candidate division Zixibacteria bacterium]NIU16563.1 hypothetical protein [candidate division Zixibacteria bacterium]NIV08681.1 hypothetical protein [candidate division Zixibacteria bacterium]NIW40020.1 hypothetical protein [candidate division Zixibacteria bacterium]